jgi:hypothetical protein
MSRARKAEKTELIKLTKAIENRMADFESAVQDLKDLKDSLSEVDDEIVARASINAKKIEDLNKAYEDNKIKAVNQAVKEIGKVIITQEELTDLRANLEKVKTESAEIIKRDIAIHKSALDDKLSQALDVQNLKHECETAQLKAEAEAHQKEVLNLKETLDRMSSELASQKKLTSDVVGANRPLLQQSGS